MKLSRKRLRSLRNSLPIGAGMTIRIRLKNKGILFSSSYIYRCLNPEAPEYNTVIIDEAIEYLEDLSSDKIAKEKRIDKAITA